MYGDKSGIMIINDLIGSEGNLMDWISAKLKFELADQDMMRWFSLSLHKLFLPHGKSRLAIMAKESMKKTLANIVIPNLKVKEVYAKLLRPLVQNQHLKNN